MNRRLLSAFVLAALLPALGFAAPVKLFSLSSPEAFSKGRLDGGRIDGLGALDLAPRLTKVGAIGEPFVLGVERHPRGLVVGTGNAGKVLLVTSGGKVEELAALAEPEVYAVAVAADGTVFAGSSPRGKVYRLREGKAEVYFDPGALYIWDLAWDERGRLLVATGDEGKLFRVGTEGRGELLLDADDTHLRTLLPLRDGGVLIGTAGQGLLLERRPDGVVRTLVDPLQPEITALALGPGDSWYAAAVASEASWIDSAPKPAAMPAPPPGAAAAPSAEATPSVTVTVEAGETPAATRPGGGKAPRSELLRGRLGRSAVERLATFENDSIFALAWFAERLWIATGVEGRLFSFVGDRLVLERDLDERLLAALGPGSDGLALATSEAGAVYLVASERERRGSFTSAALDAGQIARFGTFRWNGEVPAGTSVRTAFRSGSSAEPDATWTPWSEAREGLELPLDALRPAQYVQLRLELSGDGARSPRVDALELSYRQENLRPVIRSFRVLDPGQVLVPLGFIPAEQIYEPLHPGRGGIFTTLAPPPPREEGRLKQLWRLGYRTLRWQAEDPDGDPLEFELSFAPVGRDGPWLPLGEELTDEYLAFDVQALPDGRYRFRLRASDRLGHPDESPLVAESFSDPVVVDHTPPRLEGVRWEGGGAVAEVVDALSPLRLAELSIDGAKWQPVRAADGLLDGPRESFVLVLPTGARFVVLRVVDAAFNQISFDLTEGRR